MKKTELLIPVGNEECLYAAIHNGADAVYLGGKKFGARAFSNNFNEEEMVRAIKYCHLYGVKIYVTVNTMIYNEEIKEVMDYLNFLYQNNVDAVIMQDIGLINLTRKELPDLEIHVSTQAHNHNETQIEYFKKIGCTRVVFDRESSLEDIKRIKTPIEKEIFVYGALCICYSGNCLFSALNGGRSANRGMCVGSCRLPYKLYKDNQEKESGYLLSTKDLNTMKYLEKILSSNIESLKVEGRMKSKEYVGIVTRTYRKLIDNYYKNKECSLSSEDITKLLKTYNRGFTEGYLFGAQNIINSETSNHQGVKIGSVVKVNNKRITIKLTDDIHQEDAIRFANTSTGMFVNSLYDEKGLLVANVKKNNLCQVDNKERIMAKELLNSPVLKTIDFLLNKEINEVKEKKIPIKIRLNAHEGKNLELEITDEKNSIIVTSEKIVEKAEKQPITKERITEQISKLGGTPFYLDNIELNTSDNIFINIKDLNEIRRQAIEKLTEIREGKKIRSKEIELNIPLTSRISTPEISILVRNEDQLNIALRNNINYIYVTDEELYNKYSENKNVFLRLERVNINHKKYENKQLLCTEFGSIIKYRDNNKIHSDYYLNIANDYSINTLRKLSVNKITLSIELSIEQLENIKDKEICEVIVYGTPECMIIKNNIFNINNEETKIKNTKNDEYKVEYQNNFTHIYNHKPIDKVDKIPKIRGFKSYRIELLDENTIKTQSIINKVKSML